MDVVDDFVSREALKIVGSGYRSNRREEYETDNWEERAPEVKLQVQ